MFEVNQRVWDVATGAGIVVKTEGDGPYPVVVQFNKGRLNSYMKDGKSHVNDEKPSLYAYPVDVVKALTKPSIDWNHVSAEYKYLARDSFGIGWLYNEQPALDEEFWDATEGKYAKVETHTSYVPGDCNWEDSLVKRPD